MVPWCFPGHHQWANGLYRSVYHEFSTQQKEQSPKELHGIASLVGFFFDHLKNAAKFSLTLLFLLDRVRIAYPSSSPRNKAMSIFLPFSHPPLRYLRLFSHQTHSGHYRGRGDVDVYALSSFFLFGPSSLGRDSLNQIWQPDFQHLFRGPILFRIRGWRNPLGLFTHRKDYGNQR